VEAAVYNERHKVRILVPHSSRAWYNQSGSSERNEDTYDIAEEYSTFYRENHDTIHMLGETTNTYNHNYSMPLYAARYTPKDCWRSIPCGLSPNSTSSLSWSRMPFGSFSSESSYHPSASKTPSRRWTSLVC
jgi:hypothetical protein